MRLDHGRILEVQRGERVCVVARPGSVDAVDHIANGAVFRIQNGAWRCWSWFFLSRIYTAGNAEFIGPATVPQEAAGIVGRCDHGALLHSRRPPAVLTCSIFANQGKTVNIWNAPCISRPGQLRIDDLPAVGEN
jgi:hypothetical protein